jgi:hypothetical protein
MPVKRPFLLYLRSRLNLVAAAAGAALIVLSALLFGAYSAAPILGIIVVYAALTVVLFFSRRGAREIVQESDEDRQKMIREKIRSFAAMRDTMAVLRLGDDRMSKAVEYFLQESGAYLEKCRELGIYSPLANERIERVVEICQVFLDERDQGATSRRYEAPDGKGGDADPGERFSREIMECAAVIKERVTEDLLGQSGEERLSILKELEEKK